MSKKRKPAKLGLPRKAYRHDNKPDLEALAVKPESLGWLAAQEVMQVTSFAEKNGQFYINRNPVTFSELIIFANKQLKRKGMPQLGNNPDWLI